VACARWNAAATGQLVAMQLLLRDPAYADRLAAFLSSLGQAAIVSAPDRVEVVGPDTELSRAEMLIYLRVWRVLYPEAEVELAD
jgi:hypothetical protein